MQHRGYFQPLSTFFGTFSLGHFFHPLLSSTYMFLGHFLGHIFGTLFWDTFCGLSVLYLISLKSLTSFENIAHDGTFSTVPGCTWLCLGLPCSNLPQTATDWLKLFCIWVSFPRTGKMAISCPFFLK